MHYLLSENVHVALPLHPSGETHPLFPHMGNIFSVPLVIATILEDVQQDNDADAKIVLSQDLNNHFTVAPSAAEVPSQTAIAVLCMAEYSRLPLLMTSLLYQRWTWRMNEPLFGIGFSPYDSVVKLYVAWLDNDVLPHCVLVSYSHETMWNAADVLASSLKFI